ncbi:hypothetical protein BpHYR1_032899 [Brachionus plicatilis]|uniref:Uncharacterized protein n=1 Tax=Brachionus plicatilis TaxID=10195 RepID=A0A3M7QKZ2_BRAPC|nr:hypothetical protein BpHYR1_032899 [Brachionus plicatilis]
MSNICVNFCPNKTKLNQRLSYCITSSFARWVMITSPCILFYFVFRPFYKLLAEIAQNKIFYTILYVVPAIT